MMSYQGLSPSTSHGGGGLCPTPITGDTSCKRSLLDKKRAQWAKERAEASQNEWNPFGRPGAGAPLKHHRARSTTTGGNVSSSASVHHFQQLDPGSPQQLLQPQQRWASSGHLPCNSPAGYATPDGSQFGGAQQQQRPGTLLVHNGHNGAQQPQQSVHGHMQNLYLSPQGINTSSPQPYNQYYNGSMMTASAGSPLQLMNNSAMQQQQQQQQQQQFMMNNAPMQHQQVMNPSMQQQIMNASIHQQMMNNAQQQMLNSPMQHQVLVQDSENLSPAPQQQPQTYTEQWANQLPVWHGDSRWVNGQSATQSPLPSAANNGLPFLNDSTGIDGLSSISSLPAGSVSGRRKTMDNGDYETKVAKQRECQQQFDQQILERQRLQAAEAERERREFEQAERERRALEARAAYQNQIETNKWKTMQAQEQRREEAIVDAWDKAKREAAELKHQKLMRHARASSQPAADDDRSCLGSENGHECSPLSSLSSRQDSQGSDDKAASSSAKPIVVPPIVMEEQQQRASPSQSQPPPREAASEIPVLTSTPRPLDERPIRPAVQSPLQVWQSLKQQANGDQPDATQSAPQPSRLARSASVRSRKPNVSSQREPPKPRASSRGRRTSTSSTPQRSAAEAKPTAQQDNAAESSSEQREKPISTAPAVRKSSRSPKRTANEPSTTTPVVPTEAPPKAPARRRLLARRGSLDPMLTSPAEPQQPGSSVASSIASDSQRSDDTNNPFSTLDGRNPLLQPVRTRRASRNSPSASAAAESTSASNPTGSTGPPVQPRTRRPPAVMPILDFELAMPSTAVPTTAPKILSNPVDPKREISQPKVDIDLEESRATRARTLNDEPIRRALPRTYLTGTLTNENGDRSNLNGDRANENGDRANQNGARSNQNGARSNQDRDRPNQNGDSTNQHRARFNPNGPLSNQNRPLPTRIRMHEQADVDLKKDVLPAVDVDTLEERAPDDDVTNSQSTIDTPVKPSDTKFQFRRGPLYRSLRETSSTRDSARCASNERILERLAALRQQLNAKQKQPLNI